MLYMLCAELVVAYCCSIHSTLATTYALQVRWYGKRDGSSEAKLYVERKVHHDAMSGEESYKVSYQQ
jgi:SPX domain protein involved in polyphosphate accumulation